MGTHVIRATRILASAVLVVGMARGDASARQATIRGTVVDRMNGEAIVGAEVVVSDAVEPARTGPDGRFEFVDLGVGRYLMRFSGPGYAEREDTLVVMRPGSIDLRVSLTPRPYALDPISVAGTPSPFLARMGFYERRNSHIGGIYLDRADIEKRAAASFTDLFHAIPGTVVRSQAMGQRLVRFNRTVGGAHPDGCIPDLYVDGLVTGGRPGEPKLSDHDVVDPWHIEAIEVYTGAVTPIRYKSECGVILVWTRHR